VCVNHEVGTVGVLLLARVLNKDDTCFRTCSKQR
jgi:hypothetical protein